jgi:hypothetical protein
MAAELWWVGDVRRVNKVAGVKCESMLQSMGYAVDRVKILAHLCRKKEVQIKL